MLLKQSYKRRHLVAIVLHRAQLYNEVCKQPPTFQLYILLYHYSNISEDHYFLSFSVAVVTRYNSDPDIIRFSIYIAVDNIVPSIRYVIAAIYTQLQSLYSMAELRIASNVLKDRDHNNLIK